MIVTMGATTFLTQKQMMARNGAATDPQQAQVQKIMLYVLPFSFAIFGFSFPIGVLLYWLTTNVWSMGQQRYVIKRMPPVVPAWRPASGGKGRPPGGRKGPKGPKAPVRGPAKGAGTRRATAPTDPEQRRRRARRAPPRPAAKAPVPAAERDAAAGSRKNKARKGGRR